MILNLKREFYSSPELEVVDVDEGQIVCSSILSMGIDPDAGSSFN